MANVRAWVPCLLGVPLCAALAAVGCSSEESANQGGNGGTTTSSNTGGQGAQGAQGGEGGGLNLGGDPGSGGEEPCTQQSAEATLVSRPVDIIFVIDNSGSMTDEIREVEEQINANFAAIIDAADPPIDYRVVMLSGFGSSGSQEVCIAAPLGGIPDANQDGHCDSIPSAPVNGARFFHHSVNISSHNALCQLLTYFATADGYGLQPQGYQQVLRSDAFKFFAVITDDGVGCGSYNDGNNVAGGGTVAAAWDTALLALSPEHFGASAEERNYSFWSIVALSPYLPTAQDPYGEPHPPDASIAPIITTECTPSSVDPGTGYQALSVLTGGYRFPTCGLDYTDIFTRMALGVIEGAAVACEFLIPEPPQGDTLDLSTVQVVYSSGEVPVETFNQVADLASCDAHSFYLTDELIILCPDACATVQGDDDAEIGITFGCEIQVQ